MSTLTRALLLASLLLEAGACRSEHPDLSPPAPPEAPGLERGAAPAPVDAPAEDAALPAPPPLPPEPTPPGVEGPLTWPATQRAIEYGPVLATLEAALIARRFEAEGAGCDSALLERCYRWMATSLRRVEGEGAEVEDVLLVESDTPSGVLMGEAAASDARMLIAWTEGRYTGDAPRVAARLLDGRGAALGAPLELTPEGARRPGRVSVARTDEATFTACWSDAAAGAEGLAAMRDRAIWCRDVGADGVVGPALEVTRGMAPAVRHAPRIAWREGVGALTWVEGGRLMSAALTRAPGLTLARVHVIARGVMARGLALIAGHGGYLAVWRDEDGALRARRLERSGAGAGAAVALGAAAFSEVALDGVAVAPQGFILATRGEGDARLALLDPRVTTARLLGGATGRWVLGPISAVRVADGGQGQRFVWHLAAQLVDP